MFLFVVLEEPCGGPDLRGPGVALRRQGTCTEQLQPPLSPAVPKYTTEKRVSLVNLSTGGPRCAMFKGPGCFGFCRHGHEGF